MEEGRGQNGTFLGDSTWNDPLTKLFPYFQSLVSTQILINILLQLRSIFATTALPQLLHLKRSCCDAKVWPVSGIQYHETKMR